MKKALLFLIVATGVWIYFRDPQAPHLIRNVPSPTQPVFKMVTLDDGTYGYELFGVAKMESLKLIPNYTKKIKVLDLMAQHNCKKAVNGGFYSESDQPLGLVISDGQQISRPINSSLFNGFLSRDSSGNTKIDSQSYYAQLALQTGPMLIDEGKVRDLKLTDDKTSRRMVAGMSQDGQIFFLTVFNPQAVILGPRLDDLPQLVDLIAAKENLDLRSAINLDGGRASAFYTESVQFPEVTWVGSLLCVGAPEESI